MGQRWHAAAHDERRTAHDAHVRGAQASYCVTQKCNVQSQKNATADRHNTSAGEGGVGEHMRIHTYMFDAVAYLGQSSPHRLARIFAHSTRTHKHTHTRTLTHTLIHKHTNTQTFKHTNTQTYKHAHAHSAQAS